jgi:hypothetical protein
MGGFYANFRRIKQAQLYVSVWFWMAKCSPTTSAGIASLWLPESVGEKMNGDKQTTDPEDKK